VETEPEAAERPVKVSASKPIRPEVARADPDTDPTNSKVEKSRVSVPHGLACFLDFAGIGTSICGGIAK